MTRLSPFLRFSLLVLPVFALALSVPAFAQTDTANISGTITDQVGANVPGADVTLINVLTGSASATKSNGSGLYVFPAVRPGQYRITVQKAGFREVVLTDLTVNVQDTLSRNFALRVGSTSESVTVNGADVGMMNTQSATVGTVVDQQFVQNMPLNGRSFQDLMYMQPGVVLFANEAGNATFSANGMRTNSNYFSVDGVSANLGTSGGITTTNLGFSSGVQLSGDSLGGTNGLISVDAMQEMSIQTSTFAPEFGRTPGAQVSITSRGGTNQWHGTGYDYVRNNDFDARNFFDFAQPQTWDGVPYPALPASAMHQNDFGGTVGGPVWRDHTFFFFSYEHDKLLTPSINANFFLNAASRTNTSSLWAPWINSTPLPPTDAAYALPFGDPNTAAGPVCDNGNPANIHATNQPGDIPCIQLDAVTQSNPNNSQSFSLRMDQNLSKKLTGFVRIVHSPSDSETAFYNNLTGTTIRNDMVTAGATYAITSSMVDNLRANWSRAVNESTGTLTSGFGGVAFPSGAEIFPPGLGWTPQNAQSGVGYTYFDNASGQDAYWEPIIGNAKGQSMRQWNIVDDLSKTIGSHQLKFGVDWRLLIPDYGPDVDFRPEGESWSDLANGTESFTYVTEQDFFRAHHDNWSFYGQDTWKVNRKLTMTYGLRWDINPAPTSDTAGRPLYVLDGVFDSGPLQLSTRPMWNTVWSAFAPRIGAAYQIAPGTVVRAGFGLFHDLGYDGFIGEGFPYSQTVEHLGAVPMSFSNSFFDPPAFTTSLSGSTPNMTAVDPNLKVPIIYQWNVALERRLGKNQTITATYVGSAGTQLQYQGGLLVPGRIYDIETTLSAGSSRYNSAQFLYSARMFHGLDAQVSYTYSHSIDNNSDNVSLTELEDLSVSQFVLPPMSPSDFNIPNNVGAMVSYTLPKPALGGMIGKQVLDGWGVDGTLKIQSGAPLNLCYGEYDIFYSSGFGCAVPNLVEGQPIWIPDSSQPAGKKLNSSAFSMPTPYGTNLLGTLGRNAIQSPYGVDQTNFAVRRQFSVTERVKLNLRMEYFNLFNHPMFSIGALNTEPTYCFGASSCYNLADFGQLNVSSTYTLNNQTSGQNSLYAPGGNRSGQISLKLIF